MKTIRNQDEIPIFVIFGSSDSRDIDIMVEVDELPVKPDMCHRLAHALEAELKQKYFINDPRPLNVNLGIFEKNDNGELLYLKACWKGDPDESNNSIYYTAIHHNNPCFPELSVQTKLDRNLPSKVARAIRTILSCFTRVPELRKETKMALRGNFKEKMTFLKRDEISFINYDRQLTTRNGTELEDNIKKAAFQIGQTLALIRGIELYTKKTLAEEYPELEPFIYMYKDSEKAIQNLGELDKFFKRFIGEVANLNLDDDTDESPWNQVYLFSGR